MEFRPALERDGDEGPVESQERTLDHAMRPQSLDTFVGQARVVENLRVSIQAARLRGEPVDHILLSGLPGLGKTTLAEIISREMGVGLRTTTGPVIDKPADLAGILTSLNPGDVLFVDEIHRLPSHVEEYLYSAMEDFRLVIVLDQGARARTVPLDLDPFTLVGATTREGLLASPFRARFGIHERLDPYPLDHLMAIARRSAGLLDLNLTEGAAETIASRARGTPRLVNRYLRRIRDFAQVSEKDVADQTLAASALARLGLDTEGLLPLDRQLLEILRRSGRPVGLKSLAVAVGEEERTIEDVYEPFLIRKGLVAKTPRGRVITDHGIQHLATLGRNGPSTDSSES